MPLIYPGFGVRGALRGGVHAPSSDRPPTRALVSGLQRRFPDARARVGRSVPEPTARNRTRQPRLAFLKTRSAQSETPDQKPETEGARRPRRTTLFCKDATMWADSGVSDKAEWIDTAVAEELVQSVGEDGQ
eukprot:113422-Rhodomonas_salina.1